MIRKLKSDRSTGIATIEISIDELRDIIDSIDNMINRQQRTLLENLPSDEMDRRRLDNYKALKENLRKVWESVTVQPNNKKENGILYRFPSLIVILCAPNTECSHYNTQMMLFNQLQFNLNYSCCDCGCIFSSSSNTSCGSIFTCSDSRSFFCNSSAIFIALGSSSFCCCSSV